MEPKLKYGGLPRVAFMCRFARRFCLHKDLLYFKGVQHVPTQPITMLELGDTWQL